MKAYWSRRRRKCHRPSNGLFVRYFTAILIDLTVLNLFDEFSAKITISSSSFSLAAAILLQVLLTATMAVEHKVAAYFNARQGRMALVLLADDHRMVADGPFEPRIPRCARGPCITSRSHPKKPISKGRSANRIAFTNDASGAGCKPGKYAPASPTLTLAQYALSSAGPNGGIDHACACRSADWRLG
jgi:hypothetical protein